MTSRISSWPPTPPPPQPATPPPPPSVSTPSEKSFDDQPQLDSPDYVPWVPPKLSMRANSPPPLSGPAVVTPAPQRASPPVRIPSGAQVASTPPPPHTPPLYPQTDDDDDDDDVLPPRSRARTPQAQTPPPPSYAPQPPPRDPSPPRLRAAAADAAADAGSNPAVVRTPAQRPHTALISGSGVAIRAAAPASRPYSAVIKVRVSTTPYTAPPPSVPSLPPPSCNTSLERPPIDLPLPTPPPPVPGTAVSGGYPKPIHVAATDAHLAERPIEQRPRPLMASELFAAGGVPGATPKGSRPGSANRRGAPRSPSPAPSSHAASTSPSRADSMSGREERASRDELSSREREPPSFARTERVVPWTADDPASPLVEGAERMRARAKGDFSPPSSPERKPGVPRAAITR